MKPFRIHSHIPSERKKTVESGKIVIKSGTKAGPRASVLTRAKSDRNFLKNFRRKSSILIRLLKDKAKEERNLNMHLETLERIEGIKTRNQFFSIKCGLKREFTSTARLIDKLNLSKSGGVQSLKTNKYFSARKKEPAPLSTFYLDPNMIPECGKKTITFEDLENYLQSKQRSLVRFS